MNIFEDDLTRLNFEDFIWVVFIGLGILNIVGDNLLKDYIKTNDKNKGDNANKLFLFILFVSLIIYIYFLVRNFNAYEKASKEDKELFGIKTFGSILLILGILCLIYFQYKQSDFIGTPAV